MILNSLYMSFWYDIYWFLFAHTITGKNIRAKNIPMIWQGCDSCSKWKLNRKTAAFSECLHFAWRSALLSAIHIYRHLYVYIYIHVYLKTNVYMCICICTYIYSYMYTYQCIYMHIYIYDMYLYVHIHIFIYICIHKDFFMYLCIHVCT